MIRAGAETAVERAQRGELALTEGAGGPYEFEVELRQPAGEAMRENLSSLADFDIIEPNVVRVTAPDMALGFRRVAYLGYADRAGVTRH